MKLTYVGALLTLIHLTLSPIYSDEVRPCLNLEKISLALSLSPEDLYEVLYKQLNFDQAADELNFTAEDVELDGQTLVFYRPRLNGSVMTSVSTYCTEFGTSLFGRVICLSSEWRSVEQSLCQSLGLQVSEDPSMELQERIVRSRNERRAYTFSEGQWVSQDMTFIVGLRFDYMVVDRFACRIPGS